MDSTNADILLAEETAGKAETTILDGHHLRYTHELIGTPTDPATTVEGGGVTAESSVLHPTMIDLQVEADRAKRS
jgi:hypothetical protein